MYRLSSRSLHAAAIQGMSPGTGRRRTIPSAASAGSRKASRITSKIPGGLHLQVAVHRGAASFATDPEKMLVQLAPIGTTVPRAANGHTVQHVIQQRALTGLPKIMSTRLRESRG
jgi:hypothetical protein